MAKRRLTADEIARIHKWALERECQSYPGANIEIVVRDETDDNGEARYETIIIHERVVPRSEVPF
jgi:hypothetical protein